MMGSRKIHKPKPEEVVVLKVGEQVEFEGARSAFVYGGMPSENTYTLGIRGAPDGYYGYGYNLFFRESQKTISTLTEKGYIEVMKVSPEEIHLRYFRKTGS
ncbi:hypothetical protein JXB11_00305 [Candidatus Woesearchaeota archaeon]|nr:hypothetical protein [Candidatus Woesearchaeota archaeon]